MTLTMSNRTRWLAALALGSSWIVGAAAGMLFDRALFAYEARRTAHFELPVPARVGPGPGFVDAFSEIGVNDEQRERLRGVFDRHRVELDAAMASIEPRVRAVGEQMEREIDAILTSEQRARLRTLRERSLAPMPPRRVLGVGRGEGAHILFHNRGDVLLPPPPGLMAPLPPPPGQAHPDHTPPGPIPPGPAAPSSKP